ncbi:MAG TPA: hypothetical protein VM344_04925 [Vitreimonas sp.]|nr:hypothetical protein [Vitreimonas sp.]
MRITLAGTLALVATLILAGTALAAKPSSTVSLIVLSSGEVARLATAGPTYGGEITFEVSTTQTDRPFVNVRCYQGTDWVYDGWHGFFQSYVPDPVYILSSDYWTEGGASCVADLVTWGNNGKLKTLAKTSFSVTG